MVLGLKMLLIWILAEIDHSGKNLTAKLWPFLSTAEVSAKD